MPYDYVLDKRHFSVCAMCVLEKLYFTVCAMCVLDILYFFRYVHFKQCKVLYKYLKSTCYTKMYPSFYHVCCNLNTFQYIAINFIDISINFNSITLISNTFQ